MSWRTSGDCRKISPRDATRSAERRPIRSAAAALLTVAALALVAAGCEVRRRPSPVGVGRLKSGEAVRATERSALSPVAWSPDGRRFAYGGPGGVWVHAVGDPAGTRISPGAVVTAVAWSPGADALAYVDRGRLWTVRPDGRDRRRIPIKGIVSLIAWAPGGDRLVASARTVGQEPATPELWVSSADGAMLRQIQWHPQPRLVGALGWFPDALHLFVGLTAPGGEATLEWWQVRIAYPDFRRLPGPPAPALDPILSPTGEWVAFVVEEAGRERAYAVRRDGGGRFPLSPPGRRISGLAWAPHGDKVAYGLLLDETQAEIYAAGLARAAPVLVAGHRMEFPDPAAALSLAWAPDGSRLAYGTNTGAMAGPIWMVRFREP